MLHVINCTRRLSVQETGGKSQSKSRIPNACFGVYIHRTRSRVWGKTKIGVYASLTVCDCPSIRYQGLRLVFATSPDTIKLLHRANKRGYERRSFLHHVYLHALFLSLLTPQGDLRRHDPLSLGDQRALSTVAIPPSTEPLVAL